MSPIAAAIAMITRPNASATVNVVSGKVGENSRAAPAAENHKNHCAEKFGSKFSDQGRDFTCHDNASESQ